MNVDEFNDFVSWLAVLFPNSADWFATLPKGVDKKGREIDGLGTKRIWYKTMNHLTLEQANGVIEDWHKHPSKKPMKWEEIPGAIVESVTLQHREDLRQRGEQNRYNAGDPAAHRKPDLKGQAKTRAVVQRCAENMRTLGEARDDGISQSGLDGLADHLVADSCREFGL